MQRYLNVGGDSSVAAYECGDGYIRVLFTDGSQYLYTDASAGPGNIAQMKLLAAQGHGLNSFIMRVVRKGYASRER